MTIPVVWTPRAERELAKAAAWYAKQRLVLGAAFLAEASIVVRRLGDGPKLYSVIHRQTRRALLRRFPYSLMYREHDGVVIVLTVVHDHRHPQRWRLEEVSPLYQPRAA